MNTKDVVLKIISDHLSIPLDEIILTDEIDQLPMDSLDELELIMEIEDNFDLEIPDEQCEQWETVQSVIDYVEGEIKG